MSDRATRTPSLLVRGEVRRAALAILEEEGPEGFTVRAIARRAHVAPMAIYNHFGGLNGVIEALWIEGFESFRDALSLRSEDPGQGLVDAGLAYRAFALAHPGLYGVMFRHPFRHFEPSPEAAELAALTFQTLVSMIERAQAIGFFARQSASDAAQVIWSACHGYVALELQDMNFADDRDRAYRLLLATLRDGFR
jgi:AcrR family transcriptional regulator